VVERGEVLDNVWLDFESECEACQGTGSVTPQDRERLEKEMKEAEEEAKIQAELDASCGKCHNRDCDNCHA
jgi:hypothetical protein